MTTLNVLSLFAGIGGLELGLERAGMTVVGQVEIDPYCRRVLAKHWPDVPRHDDVRTAAEWWLSEERPSVDVICGGFPCQPVSLAGRRLAQDDDRWLWPAFAHTIRILRPRYVLMENVPGLLTAGLGDVLADLATFGYDVEWQCLPAAAFGAPHLRWRWLGVAHPNGEQLRQQPVTERRGDGPSVVAVDGQNRSLADADRLGRDGQAEYGAARLSEPKHGSVRELPDAPRVRCGQGWEGRLAGDRPNWPRIWPETLAHAEGQRRRSPFGQDGASQTRPDDLAGHASQRAGDAAWAIEPDVGRVAHGVPSRVDRLRALGNAVVPQVAEYVGRLIVAHAEARAA